MRTTRAIRFYKECFISGMKKNVEFDVSLLYIFLLDVNSCKLFVMLCNTGAIFITSQFLIAFISIPITRGNLRNVEGV